MSAAALRDFAGSPDRFGYEWGAYAELLPEHEEQFRRWTAALAPADWAGKEFLDIGCGIGRNSFWAMKSGASGGVAVDIDDRPLASARRNLADLASVRVMRASVYDLPFRDRFDLAFAIGVIHHLEMPQQALGAMVQAVKPGGRVLIWVYGRENNGWLVCLLDPLRRMLLSRLPVALTHHLSLYPAALLWAVLRLGLRSNEYFRLVRGFDFRHLRAIVFDQMLPRIAHYWPRQAVAEMMAGAGLVGIRLVWVNETSWSAVGTRPAAE